jgi:hypothetical protein
MMKGKKKQKITWNDIKDSGQEVAKHYKLDQRETEAQLRNHLHGASMEERRSVYETFYRKRS